MAVRKLSVWPTSASGCDGDRSRRTGMAWLNHQFFRFAAVGVIGFLVDATVVYLCVYGLGLGVISGRLVSFAVAVTVTWLLNRTFTFDKSAHASWMGEWMSFVAANSLGFLVNYLTYLLTLKLLPDMLVSLLLAVAAGSISGLFVNFFLSKRYVFAGADPRGGD